MLETLTHCPAHIFFFFFTLMMISWTSLFVFCGVLTPALCCDWLTNYGHYSNISLTLIHLMGSPLSKQESPVSFPYRLYTSIKNTEVESQLVFIRDSLDQIFKIYRHENVSSINWDTDKTQHFLMSIYAQREGLNTCVSTMKPAVIGLSKYYRRLVRRTLHVTGGSAASWELIRKETQMHLGQLDLLVASILDRAAASRRRSTPTPHQH